jgi:pyruvate dehydrogenase E1 component
VRSAGLLDPVIAAGDLDVLRAIERKLIWLSTWMVHHANAIRPNVDGIKVGGHQASSTSLATVVTALYFSALGPDDVVAMKAHAAPLFYAAQYLRGRLDVDALQGLRSFGGLQAYPSHAKNPEVVDLSTGSMGLGAVQATFAAAAARYVTTHGGSERPRPTRIVVLTGDAELDEGNVWEALLEEIVGDLDEVLWIVDVNRQSLDRPVPASRGARLPRLFRANGWRVVELRWGMRAREAFARPGGDRLRERLEQLRPDEFHRLLRTPAADVRKLVVTNDGHLGRDLERVAGDLADDDLAAIVRDLGGHDLLAIDAALAEVAGGRGPAVIFAHTIKGYALPIAADRLNHTTLLSAAQIEALRTTMGVEGGREWEGFAPASVEARHITALPPLYRASAAPSAAPGIPARLDESYAGEVSTQEAFGRVLGALARMPAGDRVVTVSPDVALTTHLAGWIGRKGVWCPHAKPRLPADTPGPVSWNESPAGQHIELGIAEHNLFLLLGALGLAAELSGRRLLPIGTLYDPFVSRGLDALAHALYSGARFVVVATPSGITLSPEGGAHQSVVTPDVGIALPAITYFEPAFAVEVEWILLHVLRDIDEGTGGSAYLRLSTRPIDQRLAAPATATQREAVLRGGYRLIDARTRPGWDATTNAVHLFATGVTVPEAVEASRRLAEDRVHASVFVVTSADLLYRSLSTSRPWLLDLVSADEEEVPVVSVLDGHSHALAFLGGALGVPQTALGVDQFGQSGSRGDLYRHYGIDAAAIRSGALDLLGRHQR